jgi:four helix bundle protein
MNKFEKLNVFKEAHRLVLLVYKYTERFPKAELFGLTNQLRRAAISVTANIVEGNARNHKKEYIQFIYLAIGSLEEIKYHILLAKDLGYLSIEDYQEIQEQAEIVGKLISGLKNYWISHTS